MVGDEEGRPSGGTEVPLAGRDAQGLCFCAAVAEAMCEGGCGGGGRVLRPRGSKDPGAAEAAARALSEGIGLSSGDWRCDSVARSPIESSKKCLLAALGKRMRGSAFCEAGNI